MQGVSASGSVGWPSRFSQMIIGSVSRLSARLLDKEPSMTARSAADETIKLSSLRVATGCSEMNDKPLDSRIVCSPHRH